MRARGYTEATEPSVDEQPALLTADALAANHPPHPCELVGGRVVAVSPAGAPHTMVVGHVIRALSAWVAAHDLGLVTSGEGGYWVRRDPDTVRAPDVAFLSHASLARWEAAGTTYFPSAPDLAVEVLSPDDRWVDVEQKVADYFAGQGLAVWVLNPVSRTVHAFSEPGRVTVSTEGEALDGGDVLPGFSTPVASLFGFDVVGRGEA